MKVRYFEYNNDPNGEKYIEVSEEKFIKDVIITEGRFYISFGNFVLECSESEYKEEAKRKRHTRYISSLSDGIYPTFEELDENNSSVIFYEDMFEGIEDKILFQNVLSYLLTFSPEEQKVFKMVVLEGKSETEAALAIGKTQQSVSYKIKAMLLKIAKHFKF